MPRSQRHAREAADALIAVAPLVSRWIDRLLARHRPPLTVAQFLTLRAVGAEGVSAAELAQRTGVSGPAVSQLLSALADSGLLKRHELPEDRRRQTLTLSPAGVGALASAQAMLRNQLSVVFGELPRPEAEALARALPHVEAVLTGSPPPRRAAPPRPPPHPPGRRSGPRRTP